MNEKNSFTSKQKVYLVFKRFFDIVISFIAILFCLIFIWPLITIINLLVTRGHPFFLPLRLGKNNKPFKMFKFRTMKVGAPIKPPYEMSKEEIEKLETGFGKFLRKTSLDETLQFLNVLSGKMSLIGPRPCAAQDEKILLDARNAQSPNPANVRPGLTGLAQTNMKRAHDVNTKALLDSQYVKKISFFLDCKIFFKTFLVIVHK